MKLSVIVATRNRAANLRPCLDSIAAAFAKAALLDTEIIMVDNGSTDNTPDVIKAWSAGSGVPIKSLSEPRPGRTRALNCALRAAEGNLLVFTDDDCRLSENYVNDLLRHFASDGADLVIRGGRVELGDPTDLPITIKTTPHPVRYYRCMPSTTNLACRDNIFAQLLGCNHGNATSSP